MILFAISLQITSKIRSFTTIASTSYMLDTSSLNSFQFIKIQEKHLKLCQKWMPLFLVLVLNALMKLLAAVVQLKNAKNLQLTRTN